MDELFPNVPQTGWMRLREGFAEAIAGSAIRLITPSPSVEHNFTRLLPELTGRFTIIPHGIPAIEGDLVHPSANKDRPLRAVILGRLSAHKGAALLSDVVNATNGVEFVLLGCGDGGEPFRGNPAVSWLRITAVRNYPIWFVHSIPISDFCSPLSTKRSATR
jgi:hypothetical protein